MRRRWIFHLDLDQFIAAVEIRRRPELKGKPVVVGGDGDPTRPRQVVATASYEAREYGVGSGVPMATALKRCPDAVFLPSDAKAYEAASRQVMQVLHEYDVPLDVEELGWDEAFLAADTDDPHRLATGMKAAVFQATALTCAVGIGDNTHRAKLATGFAKPGGVYQLTAANWYEVMGARSTRSLWGIGPKMERNLAELEINTVTELAAADVGTMVKRFGPTVGRRYILLGRGEGATELETQPRVPKSRSSEHTFTTDITDWEAVEAHVEHFARERAQEAVANGCTITHVGVKIRFVPFTTRIRTRSLGGATTDEEAVVEGAMVALSRVGTRRPVRLIGVRVVFGDT